MVVADTRPPVAKAFHSGMTRTERIAYGYGTPEDLVDAAADRERHRAWSESPAKGPKCGNGERRSAAFRVKADDFVNKSGRLFLRPEGEWCFVSAVGAGFESQFL